MLKCICKFVAQCNEYLFLFKVLCDFANTANILVMVLITTVMLVVIVFQRKYYLMLIDKFLSDAFESLDSIEGILMFISLFVHNCRWLIDRILAQHAHGSITSVQFSVCL